jgi:hypothetical protein
MIVAFLLLENPSRSAGAQLRIGALNDGAGRGPGKRWRMLTCVRLRAVAKSRVATGARHAFALHR